MINKLNEYTKGSLDSCYFEILNESDKNLCYLRFLEIVEMEYDLYCYGI
jgi:hypothetical protein